MKITPRYHSIPLAAGQEFNVADYDQFVTIFDITGATTCQWAFDNDNWETVLPGTAYELPEGKRFFRVRLRNPNVGAITVIVAFSPGRLYDNRLMNTGATLTAMAASLAAIDADTTLIETDIADCEALLTTIDADTSAIATDAGTLVTNTSNIADCEALLTTIDADTGAILAELTGTTTAATFGTETTLAAATATSILASSSSRHGCFVQAKSTNGASIYLGSDNTVTGTKWMIELEPGEGYTFDDYQGAIYAYSVAGADKIAYGSW